MRYAIRVLLKGRGVTAIALLALALGIGANTAIFSIVNAVLLRPLPYHDPGRLVTLLGANGNPVSPADFLDVRNQAHSFEKMGAAEAWGASLTGRETPEQVSGLHLSEDIFPLLGVAPIRGRTFDANEFQPGKDQVAVIGYALWQRSFGGSDSAVGQKILLDGENYTVIGVMPADFYFAPFWVTTAEIWAPLDLRKMFSANGQPAPTARRDRYSLRVFGRLAAGRSRSEAQSEIDQICHSLAAAYPDTNVNMRWLVESLNEKAVGRVRTGLELLLGAVGMVLLIACANVANLALARATARRKEIAVRLSLGAQRWSIARQFLTESVVLSMAGGAAGLLLAVWCVQGLKAMLRSHLTGSEAIHIDSQVLLFTLGVAILTGLLFGIAPAYSASRGDVNDALKEGARGTSGGGGSVRRALAGTEIAIALVLLIGAGLLLRSFARLRAIDPGFDAHNVLSMTVSVAGRPEYVGSARDNLYRTIVERVQAVPGVGQASMTNHLPIGGDVWGLWRMVEGHPIPERGKERSAVYRVSRPNYFATMRIPFVAGRDFDDRDTENSPLVMIVNETLAQREFPGANPLGKRITLGDARGNPKWMTIVGVVKDVKQGSWTDPAADEMYVPFRQSGDFFFSGTGPHAAGMTLVVRSNIDAASIARAVKAAVWTIDRNLPVSHVETLENTIGNATWQSRFSLLLIGIFSALALVLAIIGIYGVMAYEVAQRTHEIGIRMALGADRGGIASLIARQSLPVALAGIVCGLGAAVALSRLMRGMLYQIDPADPATFASVAGLVLIVATLAALIPARRAMRVDPMIALRHE
ncbi:MAG TPA: ABC transporter permease [Bryobacteraceae bacterium]|jgi:predicted permease|nr:ABC transporter permease [Bryobacteraceae bacterium]